MAQDTIKCYDGPSDVVQALAEDFIDFTNDEISRTETCIVGITGGTVINGLLELLNSPEYIERLNWERIFFLWTDERFLPQAHEDNYFNRTIFISVQPVQNLSGRMNGVPTHITTAMCASWRRIDCRAASFCRLSTRNCLSAVRSS